MAQGIGNASPLNLAGGYDIDPLRREAQLQGYITKTHPLGLSVNTLLGVSGTIYGAAVFVRQGDVLSSLTFNATVAAGSLTLAKGGLYDVGNAQLVSGTESSASVNGATGRVVLPFATNYTSPRDQFVYAAMIFVGTTPPTFSRAGSISFTPKAGVSTWSYWAQSGQSDLPATVVPAGGGVFPWLALA